jgi:glycosyltransferase involved in cell wall biosynthesis
MKLAWFTPFSKNSAIARFSRGVTTELAKVADLDLCYFDTGDTWDSSVSVRRYSSSAAVSDRDLERYDLLIYNFGNYLPYHREIYSLSRRFPGICILHDFVMHHFFAAYFREHDRSPSTHALLMERVYGQEGSLGYERRVWESDEVISFPLFEEVVRGALGVVIHSAFFKKRVETCFPGPVMRISLSYDADLTSLVRSRQDLGVDEDQILIVTVGHVNPNKRISDVIAALVQLGSVSHRIRYFIVGSCPALYQAELEANIQRHGFQELVRFVGHVSDEILRSYLFHADICINLRYPSMEGASASLIEEMLFGKAIVVNDVGFFSEVPNDCLLKIQPEAIDELAAALNKLVTDPLSRRRLGNLARQFAEEEFRSDRYAKELMDFAWKVRSAQPLLRLADRVALECNRMGITSDMSIVGSIARELEDLFCKNRARPPLWRE